ncbi:general transcription factor 3C polypeptide 1-like isoform X3 [Brienomyrus brachyistius]|uniref:general transcription factor 3C polypeptide 1-like isoform X3 n=1 Tax=Brienomyrus brachyistius TaxID=42636 RepID=UPI0020B1F46B|nr:general transcription factor 3C polypeptide 1-like isoform X3 [Brienomyrus brachyistius]
MDALEMLIDEVALEGLDGITISSLWIRLMNRIPKFPLSLDPATKEFVWRALVCDEDIEFYELPQKRPQIVLFDRFAEIDPETGIQEIRRFTGTADAREDVYPVNVIQEDKQGIQGSCLYFNERKNITDLIRTQNFKPCCTLEDAVKRWGEKLVAVATQTVRFRTLIGPVGDPEVKLPDHSYCILERLGRARWQGELQRDLHSRAFKTDAGKMHYMRKSLDKNGLITLQSHVTRLPNGGQQHSILLLLKRFHVDRRSKYDILMEKTSNLLSACPNNIGIMINLREQLCVSERTFKRVYQYMMAAKLAQSVCVPLQTLNPDSTQCKTKKGTDIMVRCLKLLKSYGKKDEEDDEENDEEDGGRKLQSESRIFERDILTQAYEIIISSGTKGISQTALRGHMNVGKLEARMMCRLLERNGMIKGFMEDEGRQRITKYISKIYVEQSDLNQQFAKEKARSEQLRTGKGEVLGQQSQVSPTTCPDAQPQPTGGGERRTPNSAKDRPSKKDPRRSEARKQIKLDCRVQHSAPIKKTPSVDATQEVTEEMDTTGGEDWSGMAEEVDISQDIPYKQVENTDKEASTTIMEEKIGAKAPPVKRKMRPARMEKPHQTYRLLKRKNLIIEAVRSLKIIESLFTLQKMIMDEEKQDGVSTRCCKKSIMRLLRSLSREGMLKLFRTTIVQDGISRKVEFVVHPSIMPDDPLVKSAIEQIRFRLSSSCSLNRKVANSGPEAAKENETQETGKSGKAEKEQPTESPKNQRSKTDEKMGIKEQKKFKPLIVPGLGRSLGFQPKMPRLRLVHQFLWYLIYGHPLRRSPEESHSMEVEGVEPGASADTNGKAALDRAPKQEVLLDMAPVGGMGANKAPASATGADGVPVGGAETDGALVGIAEADDVAPAGGTGDDVAPVDGTGAEVDEEQVGTEMVAYMDEMSWRRFIPPMPLHRGYSCGWALTSDILLSLPLSIFIQIIQVSYKVDDLELYLNDPVKHHYLIRVLPGRMKKQLLYKRKYIFSFCESLQRLCYMGLLQFGPIEKFQEKDQVFIFLKKNATITDTTTCDPHYNLALSSLPFEARQYTFSTFQDVENYWFDMQCVCLNTPLGVVKCPRMKPSQGDEEAEPPSSMEPERPEQRYARLAYLLRGSQEVIDDGVTPGDKQGAAGLDSCFFGHLKRNWIWTSYLLSKSKKVGSVVEGSPTVRLKNLLTKHPLPLFMSGVGGKGSGFRESPMVLDENVQMAKETSERNSRVVGGKKQRRKRLRTVKAPRKKRRVAKPEKKRMRPPFHDEADRSALLRMTRQRVTWSPQEDSLLMLCRVASHFLNRKIRKPFVPWQVVRDLLHAQFEESLDKTSLAVGRRSRYIMKNSQTDLNFKICLAEVYQDKDLIHKFQSRENNYSNPEVCASEFKEFVAVLRQKFSSPSVFHNFTIPDTKAELFRRFKVYVIGEDLKEDRKDSLMSLEDIHSLVLNNLIQSTLVLSNSQMKTSLSFQTFRIYRRYRDDILYKAFLRCQKRGLVNRRRINQLTGPKKSRALPFLPMSYQLSQTYYRCFSWRFPNTICMEARQFLETLESVGREDLLTTIRFQDQEGGDPQPDPSMVLFSLDSPGGSCVACLSLMMLGWLTVEVSIPEHIVVVDSTMVDNEVVKSIAKEVAEDDPDDDEVEEGEGRKKIEVKARQASHTNYLLMRGYCVPGIVSLRNLNTNDNIVVNSCTMRVKLRRTPSHRHFPNRCGDLLYEETQAEACLPRNFTHLLRACQDSSRLERFTDRCIHQCGYSSEDLQAILDVSSTIEAAQGFGCERVELACMFPDLAEVQGERTRTFLQYLEDLIDLEEVVEVGGNSVRLVAVKYADPWLVHIAEGLAPTGKEVPSLQDTRKRQAPDPPQDELSVKKPVLEREACKVAGILDSDGAPTDGVGLTGAGRCEEPLPSAPEDTGDSIQMVEECKGTDQIQEEKGAAASDVDSLPTGDPPSADISCFTVDGDDSVGSSAQDRVSFLSRPWRIVDGSLNKSVCKGMLEALLFHIMSKPGITEPSLVEHYQGVLQPVVVLELLQALEVLGCVWKRYIARQGKASLFSPARVPEVKESVRLRENGTPFYEPTVDCCLRLGSLFPKEDNWNRWVQFTHS